MASSIVFKSLTDAQLKTSLGKLKEFSATQPKAATNLSGLKTKLKTWQAKQPVDTEVLALEKISAVPLKAKDVAKLRAINESTTPTAEAIIVQKMEPPQIIGTLFSSLSTLEFSKMESEFKTRLATATTAAAKAKVEAQWNEIEKAGRQAFAAAGLKNLQAGDLQKFSKELVQNKNNFNAIVKISNSGVAVSSETLKPSTVLKGGWVPVTGVLIDPAVTSTIIPGVCSGLAKEGTFTKHFSKSFNLTVRIPYWCPTWSNWTRICHKNVTVAGANFSVDVSVGYRVSCCGATAWGRAAAEACVTLVSLRFCAGCSATITGVAGFGRSVSGSNCIYGLGISAQLKCTFAGITVLNLQAPFGWNVTGPCPPSGFCN